MSLCLCVLRCFSIRYYDFLFHFKIKAEKTSFKLTLEI